MARAPGGEALLFAPSRARFRKTNAAMACTSLRVRLTNGRAALRP